VVAVWLRSRQASIPAIPAPVNSDDGPFLLSHCNDFTAGVSREVPLQVEQPREVTRLEAGSVSRIAAIPRRWP